MSNIKTLKPFGKGSDSRRNIKGRPPVDYSQSKFNEVLNRNLDEIIPGTDMTFLEGIIQRMIIDAFKGKYNARRLIMLYTFGRPGKAEPMTSKQNLYVDPIKKERSREAVRQVLKNLQDRRNK